MMACFPPPPLRAPQVARQAGRIAVYGLFSLFLFLGGDSSNCIQKPRGKKEERPTFKAPFLLSFFFCVNFPEGD